MIFVGFESMRSGVPTTVIVVSGARVNLHDGCDCAGFEYIIDGSVAEDKPRPTSLVLRFSVNSFGAGEFGWAEGTTFSLRFLGVHQLSVGENQTPTFPYEGSSVWSFTYSQVDANVGWFHLSFGDILQVGFRATRVDLEVAGQAG